MITKKSVLTLILLFCVILLSTALVSMPNLQAKANTLSKNNGKSYSITQAKSAILIEATSHRVLLQNNADERLPMASTTKIMTALTVLANCEDTKQEVHIDERAVGVEGSSIYLTKGEILTVEQLLYGLMLRSGNDSAVALAIHVGGSVENFADLMNKEAQKLQLSNTHFANPNGLPNDNHYTTAKELALIAAKAFEYPQFAEIVGAKKYAFTSSSGKYYCFYNENKLLDRMDGADGVKTGYTKKAGRCFVGSATQNDMRLIAVVLNCGPMFEVCQSMLEYGYSHYTMTNIVPQNKVCGAKINNKNHEYYCCKSGFSYPIQNNSDELQNITKKITLPDKQSTQGKIEVFLDKQLLFCEKLVTI